MPKGPFSYGKLVCNKNGGRYEYHLVVSNISGCKDHEYSKDSEPCVHPHLFPETDIIAVDRT